MRSVVVVQDHAGYRQRVRALQAAHPNTVAVTPWDKPHAHARSFRPPEDWLPSDVTEPYWRRCWWKADAMGLAAVRELGIRADFYWFVESDVVATQDRWRALFADFENDPSDLVAPSIVARQQRPAARVWGLNSTPPWATHYILMACFRLSRRALEECTRCAVEMRECFSEVAIPSVVHRAGMRMTGMNVRQPHYTTQSIAARPTQMAVDKRFLSHPAKSDTFGPFA